MGLDMYLHTRRFDHSGSRWEPENDKRPTHNGWPQQSLEYDVGYWRKHAPLHNYIVRNFAYDGEDNCQPIDLSADQCRQVASWLRSKSWSTDEDDEGGFFFGDSEWWEHLKSEADEDATTFERVADWLEQDEPDMWRSCNYQASW